MKPRLLLPILAVLIALLAVPASASAYRFQIGLETGDSYPHSHVRDINPAQDFTVRWLNSGGVEVGRDDDGPGDDDWNGSPELGPGGTIQIFQPAIAFPTDDPLLTPPTAAFTVPNVTIAATPGSPTVTGGAPDGWTALVTGRRACSDESVTNSVPVAGGGYSTAFGFPATAGANYRVIAISPTGDLVGASHSGGENGNIFTRIPGDAACISVGASTPDDLGSTDPTPYWMSVGGLDLTAIPTVRMVLRRGGAILADQPTTDISLPPTARPQAGDVIEVYRPMDAPTPAFTWTIPPIGGTYDPGNDLAAIDAPASDSVTIDACRSFICLFIGSRSAWSTPAGRTILNFGQSQGARPPVDLAAGDRVIGYWDSSDLHQSYSFDLSQGDLTSPIGKISLSKSIDAGSLKKKGKVKFKLTSSEAGSVAVSLAADPSKSKKGKKPVKLGSTKGAVKVGSNKLSLKLSKSGKKALKGIVKGGKSRRATLTITLTDAAGNVTTVVKSTTLKVKKPKKRR